MSAESKAQSDAPTEAEVDAAEAVLADVAGQSVDGYWRGIAREILEAAKDAALTGCTGGEAISDPQAPLPHGQPRLASPPVRSDYEKASGLVIPSRRPCGVCLRRRFCMPYACVDQPSSEGAATLLWSCLSCARGAAN